MSALRQLVPVHDVPVSLLYPPSRAADELFRKDAAAGRRVDFAFGRRREALPIQAGGRRAGARQPVHHDVVEQLVAREYVFGVPVAVGPGPELFQHPSGLPARRVGQTVAQCLRPSALLFGVSGLLLLVVTERREGGLLARRQIGHRVGIRNGHRHVQMNPGAMVAVVGGDRGRHHRPPVAALSEVSLVAEPGHQLAPRAADSVDAPTGGGGFVRETVPRQARKDEVECVGRVTAVRLGVGERFDDFLKLHDRSGPAVRNDEGRGVLHFRPNVKKVDPQAVDLGLEGGVAVQPVLARAPVVLVAPVGAYLFDVRERDSLRPVVDRFAFGPSGRAQAVAEIVDLGLLDSDRGGEDVLGHVVLYRRDLRGETPSPDAGPLQHLQWAGLLACIA